jgi:hypothetical protein
LEQQDRDEKNAPPKPARPLAAAGKNRCSTGSDDAEQELVRVRKDISAGGENRRWPAE